MGESPPGRPPTIGASRRPGRAGAGRYRGSVIRRLLLWDIDGTLVRAGPIGATVFDQAVEDVLGAVAPERVRMSGKTDPLIVREQLELLGVDPEPATVDAILVRLAARLAASSDRLSETGTACRGVVELLGTLGALPTVCNGVLTGNIEPNARVKLAAFGLDSLVDLEVAAYGSDHVDRNELVPIAMARASARFGATVASDDVWVIGDTPRDLACARAAGVRCLLVATGGYTTDELAPLGADATLDDLADTDAVVKLVAADL
jgi:phosphoglycolate phosphatase